MFGKKILGLDASPRHLLDLCCGFFGHSGKHGGTDKVDRGKGIEKVTSHTAEATIDTTLLGRADESNTKSPDSTYGTTETANTSPANGQFLVFLLNMP